MPSPSERVVIIGSGPAGWTAAIYAARANLSPRVFVGEPRDTMLPGGQLMLTSEVENFPCFPHVDSEALAAFSRSALPPDRFAMLESYYEHKSRRAVLGPEMMEYARQQAANFGTRIDEADITRVDFSSRPFKLWSGDTLVESRAVIVATGASSIWLGIPSEQALLRRGVTSCATCDGFFHRGKPVVVVGGGDSAMEEANYLAGICESVTVVHRRDALRASKIMAERAMKNPKIRFLLDSAVEEVLDVAAGKVTGVKVRNLKTKALSTVPCTGLFVAIGHKPNTEIFRGHVALDEKGYIVVENRSTRTSVEGVFAAGDVADHVYRQAVTAAGTGCMAALDAERWLEGSH